MVNNIWPAILFVSLGERGGCGPVAQRRAGKHQRCEGLPGQFPALARNPVCWFLSGRSAPPFALRRDWLSFYCIHNFLHPRLGQLSHNLLRAIDSRLSFKFVGFPYLSLWDEWKCAAHFFVSPLYLVFHKSHEALRLWWFLHDSLVLKQKNTKTTQTPGKSKHNSRIQDWVII